MRFPFINIRVEALPNDKPRQRARFSLRKSFVGKIDTKYRLCVYIDNALIGKS